MGSTLVMVLSWYDNEWGFQSQHAGYDPCARRGAEAASIFMILCCVAASLMLWSSLASASPSEDAFRAAVQTDGACPPNAASVVPLDALIKAGRHPLCEEPKPTRPYEVVVRQTLFYFSSPLEITYRARRGHVEMSVFDDAFNYRYRYERRVPIRGARLVELLRDARIDAMWTAADPDCDPQIEKIYEINTVYEFLDQRGYRARWTPIVQDCVTPYRERLNAVGDVLMDLQNLGVAKERGADR